MKKEKNPYISRESYELLFSRKKTHRNKLGIIKTHNEDGMFHSPQHQKISDLKTPNSINKLKQGGQSSFIIRVNQHKQYKDSTENLKTARDQTQQYFDLENLNLNKQVRPINQPTIFQLVSNSQQSEERLNQKQYENQNQNISPRLENVYSQEEKYQIFKQAESNSTLPVIYIHIELKNQQLIVQDEWQKTTSPSLENYLLRYDAQTSKQLEPVPSLAAINPQQIEPVTNETVIEYEELIHPSLEDISAKEKSQIQKEDEPIITFKKDKSEDILPYETNQIQVEVEPIIDMKSQKSFVQQQQFRTSPNIVNQPESWIFMDIDKQFSQLREKILINEDVVKHLNYQFGKQDQSKDQTVNKEQSYEISSGQYKNSLFNKIKQVISEIKDPLKDQSLIENKALNQSIQFTKANTLKLKTALATQGDYSLDRLNQLDQSPFKSNPKLSESVRQIQSLQKLINKPKFFSYDSSLLLKLQSNQQQSAKVGQIIEEENENQNTFYDDKIQPPRIFLQYEFNDQKTRLFKTNQNNKGKSLIIRDQQKGEGQIQNVPQMIFVQNYCNEIMSWGEKQVYSFGDLSAIVSSVNKDQCQQLVKIFDRIKKNLKIKKQQIDDGDHSNEGEKQEDTFTRQLRQRRQGVLNLNVKIFENDEVYYLVQNNSQVNTQLKNGQHLKLINCQNHIQKHNNQDYMFMIISTIDKETRNTLLSQNNTSKVDDQFKIPMNQSEYIKKWDQINQNEQKFEYKDNKKHFIQSLYQQFQKDSFEDTFETTNCIEIEEGIKQEKDNLIKFNKVQLGMRPGDSPDNISLNQISETPRQFLTLNQRSNYQMDLSGTPKSNKINLERNSQPFIRGQESQKSMISPKHAIDQNQSFQEKQPQLDEFRYKVLQKQYSLKMGMNPNALLTRTQIMQGQQRKKLSINNQAVQIVQNNNVQDLYEFFHQNPNLQINHQNKNGNTLLILASQSGFLEAVQLLVKNDANVNLQNNDGDTALHKALLHKFYDIADFLISQGAITNIQNNYGMTPWQVEFQNY